MNIQHVLKKLNENFTDKEVAIEAGVSPNTITRLRNSVHKSTRYEIAEKIRAFAKLNGISEI